MTDQDIMPFGKYKGRRMEDVPASYLLWFYDQVRDDNGKTNQPEVFSYVEENYKVLQSQAGDYLSKHKPK